MVIIDLRIILTTTNFLNKISIFKQKKNILIILQTKNFCFENHKIKLNIVVRKRFI